MRRIFVAAALLSLTAGLSTVAASPALAHSGPPGGSAVCSKGSTCALDLHDLITVDGHKDFAPGGNVGIDMTPPPCLWIPEGDAISGSKYIIGLYGSDPSKAPTGFQINQAVAKADQLLKAPVPGTWFWLPINPNANQSGQQECLRLPAYYWATPGSNPPINIPPKTIAQYLFSGISKASVSSITVNPRGNSVVNLPTFVTAVLRMTGAQGTPTKKFGRLIISLTAHVGNQPSVTLWLLSSPLALGTTDRSADLHQKCPMQSGLAMGTSESMTQQNAVSIDGQIDCGVTFHQPSPGTFTISTTVNWHAGWAIADGVGGMSLQQLETGNPVQGNLKPSTAAKQVTVQEVQSSNGG